MEIGKINLKYFGINEEGEKEDQDADFSFIVKESEIDECESDSIEQCIFEKVYQNIRRGFEQ
jgi:hypothetical protein